jgi:type II secretory pathway pseudopilin PulG
MEKAKEKLTFSKIEILFMIVMVALVIIAGVTVFTLSTRRQNISNFKEDTSELINIAKNAHASFMMSNKTNYMTPSTDDSLKGMCITIKGLKENDFPVDNYKDWNGYIVIEEAPNKQYQYTAWVTNGKYVIDGYDSVMIKDLTIEKEITSYNDDNFTSKVKTSFTGTSGEKGGTGSTDGSVLKRYEAACINEKVE